MLFCQDAFMTKSFQAFMLPCQDVSNIHRTLKVLASKGVDPCLATRASVM